MAAVPLLLKPVMALRSTLPNAQVCLWNLRTGARKRKVRAAIAGGHSRDSGAPRAVLALGDDAVAATCGHQAR